jgi:hypothetical protein
MLSSGHPWVVSNLIFNSDRLPPHPCLPIVCYCLCKRIWSFNSFRIHSGKWSSLKVPVRLLFWNHLRIVASVGSVCSVCKWKNEGTMFRSKWESFLGADGMHINNSSGGEPCPWHRCWCWAVVNRVHPVLSATVCSWFPFSFSLPHPLTKVVLSVFLLWFQKCVFKEIVRGMLYSWPALGSHWLAHLYCVGPGNWHSAFGPGSMVGCQLWVTSGDPSSTSGSLQNTGLLNSY